MEIKSKDRRLDRLAVKALASVARGIAQDSVESRCFIMIHQPEEPKDLAERLRAMQKS